MKYQILCFLENKKNIINLSSDELAQRVVKVKALNKFVAGDILNFILLIM